MNVALTGLCVLLIAYGAVLGMLTLGLAPFVTYELIMEGTKLTREFWATVAATWLGGGAVLTFLLGLAAIYG